MKKGADKYSSLIKNLPYAYAYHEMVTDHSGIPTDYIFLEINSAFEDITGLKREDVVGKKVTEVLPGLEKSEFDWISVYGKVACTGESVRFENYSEILDRWYDVTAFSDEKGYFCVIFSDITSLKHLERNIETSERRYQSVVNTQQEMITRYLPDTTLTFVNDAYCRALGKSRQELLGKKFLEFISPQMQVETLELISKLTPEKTSVTHENKINLPDDRICWQEWTEHALFSISGEIEELQGVGRDITKRKTFEEALIRESRERAAVDAFTYSVSHDLQAPLRRIEGFSEALLEECAEQLGERANDYLKRIIKQVKSMKYLTDALISLSKVVSKDISYEEVDLSGLVKGHLKRYALNEPKRKVKQLVAQGQKTRADIELINIALGKLLENAWKFTSGVDEAQIEFGSREQNGLVVYYIRDNGAGFDMHHADKIFMPFQRLHSDDKFPGTGIGLNIAYRIISRHGGDIWAISKPGEGAAFFFTLP